MIAIQELELRENLQAQHLMVETTRRQLERKLAEKLKFEEVARRIKRRRIGLQEYRERRRGNEVEEVVID